MTNIIGFGDDLHDVLTTGRDGGFRDSVRCIALGEGQCGLSMPVWGSIRRIELSSERTRVTAIASADLSGGVRAGSGDNGSGGRVSLILSLGTDMPVTTMARAAVTATEAITCVYQDLDIRDSDGNICSGPEVLDISVVRDRGSPLFLRGAGKHNRLGQLIGEAVYAAVYGSAIDDGLDMMDHYSVLSRMERLGIHEEELFSLSGMDDKDSFDSNLAYISSDHRIQAAISSLTFLSDEVSWGLIPAGDGMSVARSMAASTMGYEGVHDSIRELLANAVSQLISKVPGSKEHRKGNIIG